MADNYEQGTFGPMIPNHLITPKLQELCDKMGVSQEKDENVTYFFAKDGLNSGEQEDGSFLEPEDLYQEFQNIIKSSNGKLKWVSYEAAFTCSKMRPDEFGGLAVFITGDNIQYCATNNWLAGRIAEVTENSEH